MDALLCKIGSLRVWVPASTGRPCDVSPEAPPRSVQVCACRSPPSSQLKAATITSSTSSTEESTSKDGASSSFNPLPLPALHSAIPAPLKFLWFNRKGQEAIESRDQDNLAHSEKARDDEESIFSEVDGEEKETLNESENQLTFQAANVIMECISESEADMLCETHVSPADGSGINNTGTSSPLRHWMSKIAAVWPDPTYFRTRSAPTNAPSSDESLSVAFGTSGTGLEEACCMSQPSEYEKDDSLDAAHSCSLEVPYKRVLHTKESFYKFLQDASLYDMKVFAQLAFLCDMAYMIPSIQPGQLLKYHRFKLVTTSLDKKAEAEAKAKENELPKKSTTSGIETTNLNANNGCVNSQSEPTSSNSGAQPFNAHLNSVQSCSAAVSNVSSRTEDDGASSISHNDSEQKSSSLSRKLEDNNSMDQDTLIAIAPATIAMLADEETKLDVAKDLSSMRSCPCEWFVCDEQSTHTRMFTIQGSESLASWQANLFFEPTQFEGLDVFVHRGIYEAAKALYDQVLPEVLDHISTHGELARARFAGHSLGGSLATLLALMLQVRGVLPSKAVLPIVTFGSPFIMCGGDYLLRKMQLPKNHIQSVIMHRDVVPRAFACDYPDHVAEVLKRLNGRFRDHPCLNNQKLLYSPIGQIFILQPDATTAPFHPLLPDGHGLYMLRHPSNGDEVENTTELRGAQRAFLNLPHPLDILSDPGAYGFDGTVSRDHDPRSYTKTIHLLLKHKVKRLRHEEREQRMQLLWPLVIAKSSSVLHKNTASGANLDSPSSGSRALTSALSRASVVFKQRLYYTAANHIGLPMHNMSFWASHKGAFGRYARVIASQNVQLGMLLVLSLRVAILECLSSLSVWV